MEYINYKKRSDLRPTLTNQGKEILIWYHTEQATGFTCSSFMCPPLTPPPPSTRSRHGMYLLNKRMCTVDQMRDLEKKNGKPFSCFAYMLVL